MYAGVTSQRGERGFSLIELIVAMFVLMIVLAMVSRVLGDGVSAKNSLNGDAAVSETVDQAIEQLSADLRAAYNPDRMIATQAELAAGAASAIDVRDLVFAHPHSLQLRTEADPTNAGIECVTYFTDVDGSMWRSVTKDSRAAPDTCADPAVRSLTLVVSGIGASHHGSRLASDASPFTRPYVEGGGAVKTAMTFRYEIANADATLTEHCTKQAVDTVGDTDLQRVVAIDLQIEPVIQSREDVSTTKITDTIVLRSRTGASYRTALGCAQGMK
jgi:Tfp pilus assembly protein PilW